MNIKRIFVSVAVAAFAASATFAFDTLNFVPKGKINTYTKTNYIVVSKFGEYYRSQSLKFVHVFNASGKETETLSYDGQNTLVDRITFEYNAVGKRTVTNDAKKAVLKDIEEAVVEYKSLRAAGRKGRPVEELIDEL